LCTALVANLTNRAPKPISSPGLVSPVPRQWAREAEPYCAPGIIIYIALLISSIANVSPIHDHDKVLTARMNDAESDVDSSCLPISQEDNVGT
jgi:hypothetical protein